jgi:mannose-1-phosphate guanylyltransferase
MRAFLLAAGLGSRLRPLTDDTPKCLLPIGGVPLLSIWLDLCARHGIGEVLLNLHHRAERVRAFLAGYAGPVRVRTVSERELLGTAGTVRENWQFVQGVEDFLILYADNLTDADLSALVRAHRAGGVPLTIGLFRTSSPESCGVVGLDPAGLVLSFVEKPAAPASNLASAGIYVAGQGLREFLPPAGFADFGLDVLPRLVGRARGQLVDGFLCDVGTPDGYRRAQGAWPTLPRQGPGASPRAV